MNRFVVRAVLFATLVGAFAGDSRAGVTLLGVGTLPGDSSDFSGLTGKAADGTPHNRLGGHGSAIAYTGRGHEYVLASDRGPKDGASDFACRYHRMEICVDPRSKPVVSLKLTATTLLTNEQGRQFVGRLDAFTHSLPEKNLRLDPEGVRVGPRRTLFVSDEYGPTISEFDAKGKRLRSLPVPDHFRTRTPGKTSADELPPKSTLGRQPNRGMEGLAISPDGAKLYGLMQGPLIQDGALGKDNIRVGRNCRILEVEVATGQTREFVYQLDDPANGLNEILAINDHEFLVIERDGKIGKDAAFKKVTKIDLTGSTDVSKVAALPTGEPPASIVPVKKRPFIDLLDKKFGIAGEECPDKFEGLAFGPDLLDGRRLLLVTADNDFIAEQPFRVYAFAIDSSDLPGFAVQKFDSRR